MSRMKVISREEIVNNGFMLEEREFEEIFGPVKEKICDVVSSVLGGLKESLEAELGGIGLLVMQSIMNLEIRRVLTRRTSLQITTLSSPGRLIGNNLRRN